jgi:hypothetical protein
VSNFRSSEMSRRATSMTILVFLKKLKKSRSSGEEESRFRSRFFDFIDFLSSVFKAWSKKEERSWSTKEERSWSTKEERSWSARENWRARCEMSWSMKVWLKKEEMSWLKNEEKAVFDLLRKRFLLKRDLFSDSALVKLWIFELICKTH